MYSEELRLLVAVNVADVSHVIRIVHASHSGCILFTSQPKVGYPKRDFFDMQIVIPKQIMRVYPKVSGLAAWSENCKWYSSLPLGAIVLLFCESV
jgi:hypothetical protein